MRIWIAATVLAGLFVTAAPASAQALAPFNARLLAAHNAVRAQAAMPSLAWDHALAASAAAHARHMAMTGRFAHSDRKARRGVGENLWMGTRGAFAPESMVGTWAAERRYFTPGLFPAVTRTGNWADVGHYTQIIWPTTTRVGCAVGPHPRIDYLVCHYSPKGNVDGRGVGFAPIIVARR